MKLTNNGRNPCTRLVEGNLKHIMARSILLLQVPSQPHESQSQEQNAEASTTHSSSSHGSDPNPEHTAVSALSLTATSASLMGSATVQARHHPMAPNGRVSALADLIAGLRIVCSNNQLASVLGVTVIINLFYFCHTPILQVTILHPGQMWMAMAAMLIIECIGLRARARGGGGDGVRCSVV